MLDIRTLAVVATLATVIMAGSMLVLWFTDNRSKPAAAWTFGSIAIAAGFLLISFRHLVPPFMSIIVANLLLVAGYAGLHAGVALFFSRRPGYPWLAGLLAAVLVSFLYFTYVDANVLARIIVVSLALAVLAIPPVRYLFWHQQKAALSERITGLVFLAHGGFMTLRASYAAGETHLHDFMDAGSMHAFAFLEVILVSFALAQGFSTMSANRLNAQLKTEISTKNRLFTILAHDLRSPFAPVIGFADLIVNTAGLSPKQLQRFGDNIKTAAERTLELLDNLLVWGGEQVALARPANSSFSLPELIDKIGGGLSVQLQAKNLSLKVAEIPTQVQGDAALVGTVLRNLIANAIKFSTDEAAIWIEAERTAQGWCISVRDEGTGIREDLIPHLFSFDQRTTTKGTRGEAGTGLGLPICRDLCCASGQDLWAENDPRGGARFSFTLSAKRDQLLAT